MDPTRSILLALARRANEARLGWHATRAAVRARGETPTRTEAYAHYVEADLCLLAAIRAADLPANFRIYYITMSRDPIAAAEQLRDVAFSYRPNNRIEAEHESARLAYKAAFAEPITAQEQRHVETLANLPNARRDKIVETADQHARHRPPA